MAGLRITCGGLGSSSGTHSVVELLIPTPPCSRPVLYNRQPSVECYQQQEALRTVPAQVGDAALLQADLVNRNSLSFM